VQVNKTYQEDEMSNLSTHVLDMMATRRLDKATAAQLLDVVWSIDGRDQRVQPLVPRFRRRRLTLRSKDHPVGSLDDILAPVAIRRNLAEASRVHQKTELAQRSPYDGTRHVNGCGCLPP
jgi:hypothetical protein